MWKLTENYHGCKPTFKNRSTIKVGDGLYLQHDISHLHANKQLGRVERDMRGHVEKVESAKQELVAAVSKVRDMKEQKSELMQQKRDLDKAVRESKVSLSG